MQKWLHLSSHLLRQVFFRQDRKLQAETLWSGRSSTDVKLDLSICRQDAINLWRMMTSDPVSNGRRGEGMCHSGGSCNVPNHPSECRQSRVRQRDMFAGSELSGIELERRWQQCVRMCVSMERCVFKVSSVNLPPTPSTTTPSGSQDCISHSDLARC